VYLLYCDETNLEERSGDFFAYGGLSIPGSASVELSHRIDEIRRKSGMPRDFRLKFNPGPPNFSHEQFVTLKQQLIEACAACGAHFFVSLVLHDIAINPNEARRNEINRICYHFDCYLNRLKQPGLVLIDRFNDGQIDAHLVEKFSIGLRGLPYSPELRLGNIVGFHYAAIGQSHFSSAVDIVLCSFRFVVNAFTRGDTGAMESSKRLLPILAPLFFREQGRTSAAEISLFFSPKVIKVDKYRERYIGLKEYFEVLGLVSDQAIGARN
jgi:hypothetical protein